MPYIQLDATERGPAICIHYRHYPGPPNSRKIVLIHELGGTLESWFRFVECLRSSFDVFVYDQRCAGRSEHTTQPFSMWDLAHDTIRFVDALGIQSRFVLMGLAMGAVTAAHVAVNYSQRLHSLILCDGTPHIDKTSSDYLLKRAVKVRSDGMRVVAESSFLNAFKNMPSPGPNNNWDQYPERFISNPPISYAMQSDALAKFRLEDSDFARIDVPTLVLTGEHDFIWPPDKGALLASQIKNSEFEVIKDAAHFPPIQLPNVVANSISGFFNRNNL